MKGSLVPVARQNRSDAGDCEAKLWKALRARQLAGVKFRRQVPFGAYVLDFYADAVGLAIEVDGDVHAQPEKIMYDEERTRSLRSMNIQVLRFSNHEVRYEFESVLNAIHRRVIGAAE